MHNAIKSWKGLKRTPVYPHAKRYGISPSSLYKALKRIGKLPTNGA